jgi:hypothetical protein
MHALPHAVLFGLILIPFIFTGAAIGAFPEPAPPGGRSDSQMITSGGSGIEWIRVHPPDESPCPPSSVAGSPGQTVEHVWCFEGAGGDSSWPVRPGEHWDHWSKFGSPEGNPTRWHVTTRHGGTTTGTYNAWVGCDSVGTNPGCPDVDWWIFKEGYGDEWNYPLVLECSGQDATSGGTIEFDLRYDVELLYDYVYLEYRRNANGMWEAVVDSVGAPAVFNGVSGAGDYGSSVWLESRRLVLPTQSGNTMLRWRAESDGAWSDADGRGDTDGMVAIDNMTVTFAADGAVVSDDFESGGFGGIAATSGTAAWAPGGLIGPDYDGWHFEYDPVYSGEQLTCVFTDDWMWSAKEGPVPSWANGFDFLLVSPVIDVSGWSAGVVEFDAYFSNNWGEREDWSRGVVRVHDTSLGWSPWDGFDEIIIPQEGWWNHNDQHILTPFLGPNVDSLQVAWELFDTSEPGSNSWGKHGGVKYYIDNVSFGSFDATETVFTSRVIDFLTDTFSRVDPAHTPFLDNAEQGDWIGLGGSRAFENADSLTVHIEDLDGMASATIGLFFRHDDGTGPAVANQVWTAWESKAMDLSVPDQFNTGWGDYRMIFGEDSGIAIGSGGEDGTGAADGFIWNAGTTVQYYVKVVDDAANEATFPATAADPAPIYFEWSVLPFRVNTFGTKTPFDGVGGYTHLLVVGDYGRELVDFERSEGFDAAGGVGEGSFAEAAFATPEEMVERALTLLYGGDATPESYDPRWDRYDVQGAGSSIQCEPRGRSDGANIGGYGDDDGNPHYDAVIWLHGTFDLYSYKDETRLELANTLDRGGRLLSSGDNIVFHLDPQGNGADPDFVRDYLGCDLPSSADDQTVDRTLSSIGASGTSLDGVSLSGSTGSVRSGGRSTGWRPRIPSGVPPPC